MRPRLIILFERLFLSAILIEVVRLLLVWPELAQASDAAVAGRIAAVLISLLLLFLTSRRASRIAGLILAAMFAIGLPIVAELRWEGLSTLTLVLQILLQTVALALLFTPESRNWFAARGGKDPVV